MKNFLTWTFCLLALPALGQEHRPVLGVFANVAASGVSADRGFTEILSGGWYNFCQNRIAPILDGYKADVVVWHLPGGRDDDGAMDFDGFQEIRQSEDPRFKRADHLAFSGAVTDLHATHPELRSVFYVGSLARDTSVTFLPLSIWFQRVATELSVYRSLPLTNEQMALAFDDITARDDKEQSIVPKNSREWELLAELQEQGVPVLIEPHPFPDDTHFFRFGFVTTSTHWIKAWKKFETKRKALSYQNFVLIILKSPEDWEAISKDPAVDCVVIPYAGFAAEFKDVTDGYLRAD